MESDVYECLVIKLIIITIIIFIIIRSHRAAGRLIFLIVD